MELEHFVAAQDLVYPDVRLELRLGDKKTHWMWFVFPQLKVLGRSAIARYYGIDNLQHAMAYYAHPVLGQRLIECAVLMLSHKTLSAHEILHAPDDLKLRSCMTLFRAAAPAEDVFNAVLQQFYGGEPDTLTLKAIEQ